MKNDMDKQLDFLFENLDLKAKSLLVTVWGDCVAPHGGTVWLRSLINLVEPLGLNDRMVRTAVFRLQKDQLLSSEQQGRKSFYSLTENGRHRFAEATHRIYAAEDMPWNEKWVLVFAARRDMSEKDRRQLQTELGWLGFGSLGAGIFAHPTISLPSVESVLSDLGLKERATLLYGSSLPQSQFGAPDALVRKGWNLETLEADYQQFIDRFTGFLSLKEQKPAIDEKKCFIIRSLLVHDYRRVLLRDPMLPAKLLPDGWNGNQARALFQQIYQQVWEGAERHLLNVLENSTGRLPPASEEFKARFGGLKTVNE
ncbi:phenylacetic acid degradation operon negative regulatory protein PaaX [Sneathiella marina]|uniref:Phenylacetic acid degradation operon negative regulatory protein PaaX n=1 Tax=Sneathiella marina TaxID=2950108 RepID=A0ABY4W3T9_9PROT|nr:phenylacetic acid degradation operon negative regulatory protein PaaX [Sneathiella marina]USG59959.1 phenylacetic acid degradation operon negative regulatory protein PaaX [Sneathiella marina]